MLNLLRFFYIAILTSFLLSCADSEDSESEIEQQTCIETNIYYCPSSVFRDPFGIALTIAWYTGQCSKEVFCKGDDVPTVNLSEGIIDDEFINDNWLTSTVEDKEPNDSFEQAVALIFRPQSGLLISGTLTSGTDPVDSYAFIVDGEPSAIIYICETQNDCIHPFYSGNDIYIELYDSNGNLLNSTEQPVNYEGAHRLSPFLINGEQYFLSVIASSTLVGEFYYKVVVTD